MKLRVPNTYRIAAIGFLTVAATSSPTTFAQSSDDAIEEIITTGTRRAERTASDSVVPIDVIGGGEFENMGTPDVDDMLRNTIPSYNVQRHAIDDAATLVRPATMRGLPPDNNLVLVNGKRRHRSGVIAELGGSLASGSQGPDISSIPAMAIKQVEILRDGASAQYGSDAIAGVMNFVLQDASEGFTAEARFGEFFEGDGSAVQLGANAGFALGDDGFANVTFQWKEQDPTSRSTQRTDAATLIASGSPEQQNNVRRPFAQIWGAPEFSDDLNLFINSGLQVSDSMEIYAFGNVAKRETEGGFFFRNPNSRSGVFTFDGDDDQTYRAIVDTNLSSGSTNVVSNCPALVSPGSGGDGVLLDSAAVAADALARSQLPANCFVANQLLPGGYTPQFGGNLEDASVVGGFRGELDSGLLYDFSAGYGRNAVRFFLNNTWNPSNGPDGIVNGALQRDFDIGGNEQSEVNLNADFVLPIAVDAFASDLNVAFGAEFRQETFKTIIGEVASWSPGRFAFQSGSGTNCYGDGVTCQLDLNGNPIPLANLSIGAHGFAGFSPQQAGEWKRGNYAVYGDLEADITDSFTLAAAIRFEDFQDFGNTTNGKLAARLALSDTLALRGSVSTGFRAPTPGQSNVTKVSTITVGGELQQRGQIPPTNPIAIALGAQALDAEDATNFTFGAVWDVTDNFNIAVDFYQIDLEDRIAQTGTLVISEFNANDARFNSVSCPITKVNNGNLAECLQETGVPGAADLSSVSFFTNDFETTTTGVDLVATWALDWGSAGSGDLTAAWNWTDTEVDSAGNEVSRDRVVELENFNSENRGIFTYQHYIGNLRLLGRASFYDSWIDADDSNDNPVDPTQYTLNCTNNADQCFDSEWIFDVEAAYTFSEKYSVIVGAQNLFDEFGPVDKNNLDGTIGSGNTYSQSTPFGQDGGFWYFRFRAEFN